MDRAGQLLEANRKALAGLRRDWAKAVERIDAAGLTTTVGLMLRKQREQLPSGHVLRQQLRFIQQEMPQVGLRTIELKDERAELSDPADQAQRRLDRVYATLPTYPVDGLEPELRKALANQRKYLDGLLVDYTAYLETLSDQEVSARRLLDQINAFAGYVDEHILWVRSTDMLTTEHVVHAGQALLALADPNAWTETAHAALRDLLRQPLRSLTLLALGLTLIVLRGRLRQRLPDLGQPPEGELFVRFGATIEAIALTAAIASVWPLLCWFAGWRLTQAEITSPLTIPLGYALKTTAFLLWPAELVRQLFRCRGVAEAHLGWDEVACRLVRVNIRRMMSVGVPLVLLVSFFNTVRDGQWRDSLGRLAFIAAMVLLAVILNRLFHHRNRLVQTVLGATPAGWLHRLRHVTQLAAMLTPLGLALAAAIGYNYSAQQLADRFLLTTWFLVAVLVGRGLIARWLFIRQWRLARHRAEQRAAAEAAAAAARRRTGRPRNRSWPPARSSSRRGRPADDEDVESLMHYRSAAAAVAADRRRLCPARRRLADLGRRLAGLPGVGADRGLAGRRVAATPATPAAPLAAMPNETAGGTPAAEPAHRADAAPHGTTLADVLITLLIAVVTILAGKNLPGLAGSAAAGTPAPGQRRPPGPDHDLRLRHHGHRPDRRLPTPSGSAGRTSSGSPPP